MHLEDGREYVSEVEAREGELTVTCSSSGYQSPPYLPACHSREGAQRSRYDYAVYYGPYNDLTCASAIKHHQKMVLVFAFRRLRCGTLSCKGNASAFAFVWEWRPQSFMAISNSIYLDRMFLVHGLGGGLRGGGLVDVLSTAAANPAASLSAAVISNLPEAFHLVVRRRSARRRGSWRARAVCDCQPGKKVSMVRHMRASARVATAFATSICQVERNRTNTKDVLFFPLCPDVNGGRRAINLGRLRSTSTDIHGLRSPGATPWAAWGRAGRRSQIFVLTLYPPC